MHHYASICCICSFMIGVKWALYSFVLRYMPKEETDDKDVKGLSGADVEAQS